MLSSVFQHLWPTAHFSSQRKHSSHFYWSSCALTLRISPIGLATGMRVMGLKEEVEECWYFVDDAWRNWLGGLGRGKNSGI